MSKTPAERAREWRDRQRADAATDRVIVAALLRAAGGRWDADGRLRTRNAEVKLTDVVGFAAYALGGRPGFEDAKARVLGRLGEVLDTP